MNTANTTIVNTFPDFWSDLWKVDQPLDFEAFLNSDVLAAERNIIKTDRWHHSSTYIWIGISHRIHLHALLCTYYDTFTRSRRITHNNTHQK